MASQVRWAISHATRAGERAGADRGQRRHLCAQCCQLAGDIGPILESSCLSVVRYEQPKGMFWTLPVGSSHCTPHGGAAWEGDDHEEVAIDRHGARGRGPIAHRHGVDAVGHQPKPRRPGRGQQAYCVLVAGAQSCVLIAVR